VKFTRIIYVYLAPKLQPTAQLSTKSRETDYIQRITIKNIIKQVKMMLDGYFRRKVDDT
jgi:hypothetical protein